MLFSACSFIKIKRKKSETLTRDNYEVTEEHFLLMLSNQLISCSVFSKLTSKVNIVKLFDKMGNARFIFKTYQDVLQSEHIAPYLQQCLHLLRPGSE